MKTTIKKITAGTFFVLLLMAASVMVDGATINSLNIDSIETGTNTGKWIDSEISENSNILESTDLVQESDLELENWMFNDRMQEFENSLTQEAEMNLELQGWMINENFRIADLVLEPELRVEPWMMSKSFKK